MGERVWAMVTGCALCACGAAAVENGASETAQPPPPIGAGAPSPARYPGVVRIAADESTATPTTQPEPSSDAPPVAIYDHGSGRSTASFADAPVASPISPPAAVGATSAAPPPAPPPTTSAATPQTGNVSNAAYVVAAMRSDFRVCYQTALAEDRALQGTVRLVIRVGSNGFVSDVKATPQALPQPLVDCVVHRAYQSKFDPPEGGSAVIAVPVTFVKN